MDNLDKLIDAIEHPERYSESDLHALLSNPETRRFYRLMCASRAYTSNKKSAIMDGPDADMQWKNFIKKRRKRLMLAWVRQKKVAAVLIALIASCSIIMVGISLSHRGLRSGEYKSEQSIVAEDSYKDEGIKMIPSVNDTVIVFEDKTLDIILDQIAPFYNAKVDLKSSASRNVRLFLKWDSTTDLTDLMEQLNSFERINLILKNDTIKDF